MDKWTAARTLDEIARYLELSGANAFKARAFEHAARAIESSPSEVTDLVASGDLYQTSGIGKSIGPIVVELVQTGRSRYLEDLREQYPPGIFDLLRIPNFGLKKIGVVYSRLSIASIDELEAACLDGRIAKLPGFGTKTQEKILEGIEWARKHQSRFLLPTGLAPGETIRERLAAIDEVDDAEVAGSVRRRLEVVRNVNVVVATRTPRRVVHETAELVESDVDLDPSTWKGEAQGEIEVLFHIASPEDFGATMLRATG